MRTVFGKSKELFDGTTEDFFSGYGVEHTLVYKKGVLTNYDSWLATNCLSLVTLLNAACDVHALAVSGAMWKQLLLCLAWLVACGMT